MSRFFLILILATFLLIEIDVAVGKRYRKKCKKPVEPYPNDNYWDYVPCTDDPSCDFFKDDKGTEVHCGAKPSIHIGPCYMSALNTTMPEAPVPANPNCVVVDKTTAPYCTNDICNEIIFYNFIANHVAYICTIGDKKYCCCSYLTIKNMQG